MQSSQTKDNKVLKKYVGISILKQMEDTIKETKMVSVDMWILHQVWGNSQFDFASISSRGVQDAFLYITGTVLEKGVPDHRPILIKESVVDYGPTLFRFFHSWLDVEMRKEHQALLSSIDVKVDQGSATPNEINARVSSMKVLSAIDKKEASDLAQKANIKWAIEGDENTSLFHGVLKKSGVKLLSKRDYWECDFSNEEIKRVFGIVAVTELRARMVSLLNSLKLSGTLFNLIMEQSAFIKGRNILDGPLILNECITWYRKRKKELLVFKVDFEKAFDSLRRDYLDVILENLVFGFKLRTWIDGCLKNSRASVLVNGSPTAVFEIFKGLRQGDPLSPFLFILAMEGLHASIRKAVDVGVFKGASIGQDMAKVLGYGVSKLHMMYLGVPVGVVGNLPTYYMSLYLMPTTMRKKLEAMRNRFFLGGNLGDRKVSWIKWITCLASKAMCGLGIGGKRYSWPRWRYWLRRMPREGIEFNQFTALLEAIRDVSILDKQDGWKWALNSKGFTVASARIHIDEHTLIGGSTSTRWPKCVLIKVNVFMWRLSLDKLTMLMNMDRKGIDVAFLLCPVCCERVENVNHLFFSCGMSRDLWARLAR
nr:hypothetical protein [Tanacetum cinerariifolium]